MGTGYYTAVLSRLVGEAGHIIGIEFDPELFKLARGNLSAFPNVSVVHDDAWPNQNMDGIYVNFGVSRPAPAWLDYLGLGGRLVFPLGVPSRQQSPGSGQTSDRGAALCVSRTEHGFGVIWLGPCWFVCAEGALLSAPGESEMLRSALMGGGIDNVRSLRWREPASAKSWFVGPDWSLSYDAV